MLPLKGITVVSLEQAVAAPYATRQLADLGARVIKVERPGGDFARHYDETVHGMSSAFVWLNRSKESLTLDLKESEGKRVLDKILSKADVFIQNLAPGAINRLGFNPEELKKKYPQLIICGISGYGTDGPYKDKKAYDLLIQCEAGLMSITGTEDTPSRAGISIADIAAGMYAYTGILTALFVRKETNKGTVIEISMLEALSEWLGYPLLYSEYGGSDPKRTGSSHAAIYPYGPFKVKNAEQVFLAIQNEREWKQFCEKLLKNPSLTNDPRFNTNSSRVQHKEVLKEIVEETFKNSSAEEIITQLENTNIANAQLNTLKEVNNHPQLKYRERWREIDTPRGVVKALIPPVTSREFHIVMNPVPELGEHTKAILKEFGFQQQLVEK
ncbi:CaiB/BaiF CoA-transferase family protein [Psychrobacillus sp. FJAT-51614]|uniref:CaiB/BaiF CoA-transferase family protein n=1 Tax=Psychrobacillus mangrovi TaxID=3117745 RepID=A0ABU8F163_9BACI